MRLKHFSFFRKKKTTDLVSNVFILFRFSAFPKSRNVSFLFLFSRSHQRDYRCYFAKSKFVILHIVTLCFLCIILLLLPFLSISQQTVPFSILVCARAQHINGDVFIVMTIHKMLHVFFTHFSIGNSYINRFTMLKTR